MVDYLVNPLVALYYSKRCVEHRVPLVKGFQKSYDLAVVLGILNTIEGVV